MRWLLASMMVARVAHAEPDIITQPLVLARGEIEVQLVLEASLRPAFVGRPLSLAPDAWIGVTPDLTVGVIHSDRSVDQIDTGDSFCVRARALDCDQTYQGSGLDARYAILRGPLSIDSAPLRGAARPGKPGLAIALRGRFLLRDVEPAKPALTVGALARWTRSRFAITSDPYVRLGLANRDRGNRAALVVPLWLAVQPTCRWVIALHTGYDAELANARDGFHVPIALNIGVRPIAQLELAVEIGFPSLLGPQNQIQERAVHLVVGWRQRLLE